MRRAHISCCCVALLVACFGLAAHLEPQFQAWRGSRASGDIFNVVLGDSRRMFANSFYVKADEYYHSGYYPTIFDNNEAFKTAHMAEDTGAVNSKNHGDEPAFSGRRRNWIDAFGRHFFPDRHTHLDEGGPTDDLSGSENVREILPWLKLSADLDPDNVQTYTVTAFWLRQRMNNVAEADAVLHEGLRNCPGSYDILFELGRLYYESYHDHDRARNVWEFGASANGSKFIPRSIRKRKRTTGSSWNSSPPTSPSWRKTPAICRARLTGFRPRKKFPSRPTPSRSRSAGSRASSRAEFNRRWRSRCIDRAIPLGLSAAALV